MEDDGFRREDEELEWKMKIRMEDEDEEREMEELSIKEEEKGKRLGGKKIWRDFKRKNFEREKFAAVEQALATRRIHLQRALGASACAIIW